MLPFQTILIAADFSESSREAFRAACSLAREDETRVIVLNVMEPRYVPEPPGYLGDQPVRYLRVARPPSEHESLQERLREVYTPDSPLDVEYQTREGDAAEEILRAAEETRSDLIVMGTHGRTGLRRLLAGSIAETVLRKARCPVLALRPQVVPRGAGPIRVILHPTDFSEGSEASLRVARLLARDHGARLVLLHVTPPPIVLEGAMAGVGDPRADLDSLEAIRGRIDGPDLKSPGGDPIGRRGCGLRDPPGGRGGRGRPDRDGDARAVRRGPAPDGERGRGRPARAGCPVLVIKGHVPAAVAAASPVPVGP